MTEISFLTLAEAARLIESRQLSPVELARTGSVQLFRGASFTLDENLTLTPFIIPFIRVL